MTTLFVISVILLAVSLFFNVRLYQIARHWQKAYLQEKRAGNLEAIIHGVIAGVMAVVAFKIGKNSQT